MKKIILWTACAMLSLGAAQVWGAGFQASLTPDNAIVPKTERVKGVSLNIWGENPQNGFALGIINGATEESNGFSLALFHNYADIYDGAQVSLFNEVNTLKGVQLGFINYARVSVTGAQLGLANINEGETTGAQLGLFNYSGGKVTGAQLGFVNYTKDLHGLQLGLINYVESFTWFQEFPHKLAKGFVFVNWGF